jgi:hypothetical protein
VVRKTEKARVNNSCNWRAPIAFHLENYRWLIKGEVDAGWISIGVDFVAPHQTSDFKWTSSGLPMFKKKMEST